MDNLNKPIEKLHSRGAHFVLCQRNSKQPVWRGWQKRRPGVQTVVQHAGNLGVIPASLGTSALDIDYGDIGELVEVAPPMARLPSKRGPDRHMYYRDNEPRGNSKFAAYNCRGEVRSASGFLVLWPGGAEILDAQLTVAGGVMFPADLFAAAGVKMPAQPADRRRAATVLSIRPRSDVPLEEVFPGGRHVALFDEVRFWAYTQPLPAELAEFVELVTAFASSQNARFPVPESDREIERQAYSIAAWVWDGGGPLDHSPAAQRRRGVKSGLVRRGLKRGVTVHRKGKRGQDARIVEAVIVEGRSCTAVAGIEGLTQQGVQWIVERDAPLEYAALRSAAAVLDRKRVQTRKRVQQLRADPEYRERENQRRRAKYSIV